MAIIVLIFVAEVFSVNLLKSCYLCLKKYMFVSVNWKIIST